MSFGCAYSAYRVRWPCTGACATSGAHHGRKDSEDADEDEEREQLGDGHPLHLLWQDHAPRGRPSALASNSAGIAGLVSPRADEPRAVGESYVDDVNSTGQEGAGAAGAAGMGRRRAQADFRQFLGPLANGNSY